VGEAISATSGSAEHARRHVGYTTTVEPKRRTVFALHTSAVGAHEVVDHVVM
jgi:hypothetical protein